LPISLIFSGTKQAGKPFLFGREHCAEVSLELCDPQARQEVSTTG
jgi:hypothetical protein